MMNVVGIEVPVNGLSRLDMPVKTTSTMLQSNKFALPLIFENAGGFMLQLMLAHSMVCNAF